MAEDKRFEQGLELLRRYVPNAAELINTMLPNEPDLLRWAISVVYGELYQRKQLAMRDRMIATLTALTAVGAPDELVSQHVTLARGAGLSAEEILEVVMHTAVYAGFPKAVAATRTAMRTLAAEG